MAKFKNPISKIKLHEVNHVTDKTVSYSQYSIWKTCQHQWYLNYAQNKRVFSPSIHAVFGTAIHETLQHYLNTVYSVSNAQADNIDLDSFLKECFTKCYKENLEQNKNQHFSSPDELREFYDDGVEIIKAFKRNKVKWFGNRGWHLIGIEIPIMYPLENKANLYLKGFIDIVVYDESEDKYYIYDFKTSTRGWSEKEKKNQTKLQQILLYKKYFGKLYNIDIDKINVEFIIVKRKIWSNPDFTIPRLQGVAPAAGKTKMKQAEEDFQEFLNECFTPDGNYIFKEYPKTVSDKSCKWCPYSNNGMCDKGQKKPEIFLKEGI